MAGGGKEPEGEEEADDTEEAEDEGGEGGQLLQGGDEPEDQQCIADEAKGKEKYNLIVEGVNEWRTRE